MDSSLRRRFLLLLDQDLRFVDERMPEQAFNGQNGFALVEKVWRMAEARNALVELLSNPLKVELDHPLPGGLNSCDCVCHLPIAPGWNREGRPTSCSHCQLIA